MMALSMFAMHLSLALGNIDDISCILDACDVESSAFCVNKYHNSFNIFVGNLLFTNRYQLKK